MVKPRGKVFEKVVKRRNSCQKNKAILLVTLAAVIAAAATIIAYNTIAVLEVHTYNYSLTVGEAKTVGLNADTSALHFGKIPAGGFSQRYINITNSRAGALKAVIRFSGTRSEWIKASDNRFVVGSGQTKEIALTASVPKNAKPCDYAGIIKIIFLNA